MTAGEAEDLGLAQVAAAFNENQGPDSGAVTADPFWRFAHGYQQYRGESQRQAARAAVLCPPGETLTVALPTGRGKTAVAWSRTLLSDSGTTIVVVPTVVLALDMERRTALYAAATRKRLSPVNRYAYISDVDDAVKEGLRQAVRNGDQRILYTSPEAFVMGLARAVLDCASNGHLQQVVVDEAHLVDQWGNDFRPEFQTMSGLLQVARERAPKGREPVVLLLSATLADRHLAMLDALFSAPNRHAELIWGTQLRAEPAFFHVAASSEEERASVVLHAIARLPRPMILYTTEPKQAKEWVARLTQAGMCRVASVTGDSSAHERQQVVCDWRGMATTGSPLRTSVDVVVGTSAFGLGIDVPNVRTIVHACVPETIDRFYQEVGRGGRDGLPVVSCQVTAPRDFAQARGLNTKTLIGDELGWKRWQAMRASAQALGGNRFRTRRSTLPAYLAEGFGRSAQWNSRTLTLMGQAGILRLIAPDVSLVEADGEDLSDWVDYELLDGTKLARHEWAAALQLARKSIRDAQGRSLDSMLRVTAEDPCVGRVLAEHYTVKRADAWLPVHPVCRGCPTCRRESVDRSVGVFEPSPALPDLEAPGDPLAGWRGKAGWAFIRTEPGSDITGLLTALVRRGLNVLSGVSAEQGLRIQRAALPTPVILDDPTSDVPLMVMSARPIVHVLSSGASDELAWERIRTGLPTYVLGPSDAPDPEKLGWLLRDTADVSIGTADLQKEL